MFKVLFGALLVASFLCSCTDARFEATQVGVPAHIRCYSGTLLIYEGNSTGNVFTEGGSDSWFFEDKATHKIMHVSGACIIVN